MTEETRPGFLANYIIVRPGPARIRPGPVDTSNTYIYFAAFKLKYKSLTA